MVRSRRATLCVLNSPKKDGVAKEVAAKTKSTRILDQVMTLTMKETIGNVKTPTKDEDEGDNDDWKDEESDLDFGQLVHVRNIRSSGDVYELTRTAVSSSLIHNERLHLLLQGSSIQTNLRLCYLSTRRAQLRKLQNSQSMGLPSSRQQTVFENQDPITMSKKPEKILPTFRRLHI